jgi:hypothetical protein
MVRTIRDASEDEVVAAFLQAEIVPNATRRRS